MTILTPTKYIVMLYYNINFTEPVASKTSTSEISDKS